MIDAFYIFTKGRKFLKNSKTLNYVCTYYLLHLTIKAFNIFIHYTSLCTYMNEFTNYVQNLKFLLNNRKNV